MDLALNQQNLHSLYRLVLCQTGQLIVSDFAEYPSDLSSPWPMFAFSEAWGTSCETISSQLVQLKNLMHSGQCCHHLIVPRSETLVPHEQLFLDAGFVPLAMWPAMSTHPAMREVVEPDDVFFASSQTEVEQWLHIVNTVHFPQNGISLAYLNQIHQSKGLRLVLAGPRHLPTSACMVYDDGYSIGIYMVATLPEFRGKGQASNMIGHLVKSSNKTLILQATLASAPVYKRLGFENVGAYIIYRLK